MNDRGPRDLALRALRDCGVIRADDNHRAFMRLYVDCLAETTRVPGRPYVLDFRLNEAGRKLALRLKPWAETQ